ncbi:MAG TPA: IPT/TIG domain-containing protein [Pyrinomonadaceae bacterium]|nr:IPT/TIG domain-containing protein [Pyrinomonadaceae bacterium]
MNKEPRILTIDPPRALPGAEVIINCENLDTADPSSCSVWFGDERASLVALSPRRVLAIVPEQKQSGEISVRVESHGIKSTAVGVMVGRRLAEDLHPVTNPAFDPDDGALFVTRSGSRGEQLPVTLFKIDGNGELTEFSGDITNPTSIAFDSSGQMFVTSRLDGTVYRITPFKEAVPFVRNLGVATGLAFDKAGTMYVGDRTGTIYKVNGIGEETAWAQLEPSVSAYHIAVGPDDALYVAGPTVASFDSIMRIDEHGEANVFYKGLGRPQGLAFDSDGNLLVAASLRGRRGIVRISPDGKAAEVFVTGINLVGLAIGPAGDIAIASTDSIFRLSI